MSFETEKALAEWWLNEISRRLQYFTSRFPVLSTRLLIAVLLVSLPAYAVATRTIHLIKSGQYNLISVDSHFFHWLAARVMAGEGPPIPPGKADIYTLHSGLAYPLAYMAKAVSVIFNISDADSLDLMTKLAPPLLAVVSMAVIYFVAAKLFNRRVGLLSAFAWAAMFHAILFGTAGYLDRDGLSILLIILALSIFYLSREWHPRIGNMDVGWLVGGLAFLIIEGLLYLEWSFVGPVYLIAVLVTYFTVRLLLELSSQAKAEPNVMRRLTDALGKVHWQTFAVIISINAIAVIALYTQASVWLRIAISAVRSGGESIIWELQGIGIGDIFSYAFFIPPMILGLYFAFKKKSEAGIFFSCWFLCLLVLSFFAKRTILYTAPAACVLSGIGLAYLLGWQDLGQLRLLKKLGVASLVVVLIVFGFLAGYSVASIPYSIVDEDWHDALIYLRENTPDNAVIMTQWSWGYWVLDVGQRRPVVDNGYYGWDFQKLKDVGVVYTSTDVSEAVNVMTKYDADYIVFCEDDLDFAEGIMSWVGLNEEYDSFPEDSLVVRSLDGNFDSEGGLETVYRSSPNSEVVILSLVQSE